MESRRGFLLGLAIAPLSLSARSVSRESSASIEQRVFSAINLQRVSANAAPLIWSDQLGLTARAHSARMLQARFFGHEDPKYGDLSTRLAAAGVDYQRCAENVFRERNYNDPVAVAIAKWMYSEAHRQNLLQPEYTHTGVGVAEDSEGTVTLTQQFLTPPR
jgi:uncharacterized protein YkwD